MELKQHITDEKTGISYPSNGGVFDHVSTDLDENYLLKNETEIEIKFSHIGGVHEGQLGGGSAVTMLRVEASKVGKSNFIPSYVQGTDHRKLGEFVVAKLKVTGTLELQTDSDFTDIDGATVYAVIPKSMLGTNTSVRKPFEAEYAFWYSSYILLIAQKPTGKFTKKEEKEVISILASFVTES